MSDEFERRIRDAVASEGAGVRPDDASLATIRHRVARSKRRRLVGATALGAAAALVIGIAIGAAVGGDDTTDVAVGDGGSTTTSLPCATSTSTAPATATTGPPSSVQASTTTSILTGGGSSSTSIASVTTLVGTTATEAPPTTVPPAASGSNETIVHEAETFAEANGGSDCAGPSTSATQPPGTPTTGTTTTITSTTTIADDELAAWPQTDDPRSAAARLDPVETARAFLTKAIGIRDPALGPFVSTGENRATISLYSGHGTVEPGAVERSSLVLVRRPSGEWVIHAARSDAITIDRIGTSATHTSVSVTAGGKGRGFEGVLHATVQGDGAGSAGTTMASGGAELAPYEIAMDVPTAAHSIAVIIFNDSGEEGGSVDVAARVVPVSLP